MAEKVYDCVVIGAGPAGLNAGLYLKRYGVDCIILRDPEQVSQVLITNRVDNYLGIQDVTGPELMDMFEKHLKNYNVEIVNEKTVDISKEDELISVKTNKNVYTAKAIIIATGARHRKGGIKGESEFLGKGVSYCATCDGYFFKGKKVAVLGGGDSALTSAIFLKDIGCDVTLIHRRKEFRGADIYVKTASEKGVKFVLEHTVKEIKGSTMVEKIILDNGEEIECSGVFIAFGEVPVVDIARKAGVRIDESDFIVVDKEQSTNVEGIYAAGDVCNNPLKQIVTAVADGAVAAFSVKKYITTKK